MKNNELRPITYEPGHTPVLPANCTEKASVRTLMLDQLPAELIALLAVTERELISPKAA